MRKLHVFFPLDSSILFTTLFKLAVFGATPVTLLLQLIGLPQYRITRAKVPFSVVPKAEPAILLNSSQSGGPVFTVALPPLPSF